MTSKTLHEKLLELKKELPYFKKNTTGVHAKFVTEKEILIKVNKYLNEKGISLTPKIISSEVIGRIIKLDMVFTWDDGKESIDVPWLGIGEDKNDMSMAMGKALTYTNRYFLLKFFNIPTGNDDPDLPKEPDYKNIIDQAFKNPSEEVAEGCLTWLEKQNASKDIISYYQNKADDFFNKLKQLQENKINE